MGGQVGDQVGEELHGAAVGEKRAQHSVILVVPTLEPQSPVPGSHGNDQEERQQWQH